MTKDELNEQAVAIIKMGSPIGVQLSIFGLQQWLLVIILPAIFHARA